MTAVVANDYSSQVADLIPAFPKSGPAKYRLLDHGGYADEVNERDEVLANRKVVGEPTKMVAQNLIYDPGKQDSVPINVSKSRRLQGFGANQQLTDVLEYLTFDRFGELTVTPQMMATYRFLELHPRNRTNVLTGIHSDNPQMPEFGWLFERVEPEKSAADLAKRQRLIDKIRGILGDNSDSENLEIAKRLPRSFKLDLSQNADGIYSQLRAVAERDPDTVYLATTDNAAKMDALITDALAAQVLVFRHEERQYVDGRTNKAVLNVPTGEPREALRDWLLDTQGASTRKMLQAELADKGPKPEKQKGIRLQPGQPVPEGYNPKPGKLGYHYPLTDSEN